MRPFVRSYQALNRSKSDSTTSVAPRTELDTMLTAVPLELLGGSALFTATYFIAGGGKDYGVNDASALAFGWIDVFYMPAAEALLTSIIGEALTHHSSIGLGMYIAAYVANTAGLLLVTRSFNSPLSKLATFGVSHGFAVLPSIIFYTFVHEP